MGCLPCASKKKPPPIKGKNGRRKHTRTSEELRKDAPQLEVAVPSFSGLKVDVALVNAFTRDGVEEKISSGNPAGVCVLDKSWDLDDDGLQAIATQIGFSETAFYHGYGSTDAVEVQFFTPDNEVDLCGHATIATWAHLLEENVVVAGNYAMQTKAGLQMIKISEDGTVGMTQNVPKFNSCGEIDRQKVAEALGLTVDDLSGEDEWPIRVGSSGGTWKLMVFVKDEETLKKVEPNQDLIKQVAAKYDAVGFYTMAYLGGSAPHPVCRCRNFSPGVGIMEDAATGTSASTAAAYLLEQGKIVVADGESGLVFEQGDAINRPASILVNFSCKGKKIKELWVSGKATTTEKKTITL